jgi:antitoxin component YwqK of YwqJK toxin-antitoxin module
MARTKVYWNNVGHRIVESYKKKNNRVVLEGKREQWYDAVRLYIQEFYLDGNLEGERKVWYENGNLEMQEFYHNDKLEGARRFWHVDGKLKIDVFYREDKLEGKVKSWHDNGQLKSEGTARNDKLEGEHKEWDLDGKLSYTYFVNGKLIDPKFSWEKKYAMINVKRRLYFQRTLPSIDPHMISDLSKIVCEYVSG